MSYYDFSLLMCLIKRINLVIFTEGRNMHFTNDGGNFNQSICNVRTLLLQLEFRL